MQSQHDHHSPIDLLKIETKLKQASTDKQLYSAIVNAPFDQKVETAFLFLGIIVLLIVNPQTKTIDRIALSNTELAKKTTEVTVIPFEEIKIPLNNDNNIISQAIKTAKPQDTVDWGSLFYPALTPEEARINQASAGIAYSAVYPLKAKPGAALIFSYFQYESHIGEEQHDFMKAYAGVVSKHMPQGLAKG